MSEQSEVTRRTIRIGTRESALAMWQARHVAALLSSAYPDIDFPITGMTTTGDKNLQASLSSFANKGVFTKELDIALLASTVDIVVHCMKDLPTVLPDGLAFCAVMERSIPADAVVLHPKHLDAFAAYKASPAAAEYAAAHPGKSLALAFLPQGSVVGTSALRRRATLARHHPHLVTDNVRGNVQTRLSKLDSGLYDAIILAEVGLTRVGLTDRIAEVMAAHDYLHAVGQGALAITCRTADAPSDDVPADRFSTPLPAAAGVPGAGDGLSIGELTRRVLHDARSEVACAVERGMLAALQGGCKVPIAAATRTALLAPADAASAVAAAADAAAAVVALAGEGAVAVGDLAAAPFNGSAVSATVALPAEAEAGAEAEAEGAVDVVVTRGAVMSLDGSKVSECDVVVALPTPATVGTGASVTRKQRYDAAWAAGVELGARLNKLGAETILREIR